MNGKVKIWSSSMYLEVKRKDIALLKFILESFDNLAYFSVIDKYRAVIRIVFPCEKQGEVDALLQSLPEDLCVQVLPHQLKEKT